ncbi:MAG: tRNA (adenosine(37)-N6)-threonylcarbamoyltransferase complex dimerization subunit type 1 TsaB [Candidatus Aminicenantes bacterium]|jgi:tRNA threonylcarbamoyladenosine biosynthesis protein TsaB
MLILAVDTTTPHGSVALLENSSLLAEVNGTTSLTHSERLLPAVDLILLQRNLTIKDVEAFAVAVGPGSFTGIRIGLSTIKSFALATRKPIAPVSTLEALAIKLKLPHNRLLCPLLDARKGEVYAALFEVKKGELIEIVPQGVYAPDHFFASLPAHRILSFIGNGVDVWKKKIFEYFKDKARFSSRSLFIAHEVGLLGYGLLKKGLGQDFREVKPLYFRRSQAEENH